MSAITLEIAVEVCRHLEEFLAPVGWHTALTGGCLYRGESRKDIDIHPYTHDPSQENNRDVLHEAITKAGFINRYIATEDYVNRVVWIYGYEGKRIDLFLP